ncbi:MAG: diguanylate cyclase [Nocardioidaceae bacterium]|nr:diguanylate cyclase [Nocardioidaceae bacterium]NUS51134.1 diguanylate cyclase [Nocardioidaceae bacterium]
MATTRAHSRGLVDELQSSHRFTLGVLLAVLVVSLATSGYLLLVSQPRLASYVALGKQARDAHEGMLDQETGLRAWLATGDRRFLGPYESGKRHTRVASDNLMAGVHESPDVTDDVLAMLLAEQRWRAWSDRAANTRFTADERDDGTLTAFLLGGKRLFDAYRVAETTSTDAIRSRREQALDRQQVALVVVLVSYLVLLAGTGAVTVRRRRQLDRRILGPIDDLHGTVQRLRDGDLSARAEPTGVPELAEIGGALGQLASELDRASRDALAREQRLARLADRFETVVSVGREIAGSLSVRYVSATVTSAAADLLGERTTLWVRDDNQEFRATHRSEDPHGTPAPVHLVPSALVQRAAAEALPAVGDGCTAYPLVLAGMVTAVLETASTDVDEDTEQVLAALLSTAAAALESAHLHSAARELADMDGLTQLPNRRRFELDVDTEWERCRRYGRPLSLVMMDLDHFKRLNDEHGHLIGDEVLREVAHAVTGALRTTDTAYRYGGEEIVVLLRETGLEDAASAADRLRAAVEAITVVDDPRLRVTGSAGVAARHATMSHYTDLVAEADKALYDAKRAGRNRVAVAGMPAETLFRGTAEGSVTPA